MSDTQAGGTGEQQQPPITVNGQYIKDLSFESPNAPAIFAELQNTQPDINVNIDVKAAAMDNPGMHEVTLEMQAGMKVGDKTGFLVEVQYAGVFTLNLPEEHLHPVLMIECPRILFPFARQVVSDATQQGGFMPLYLQPIDFAALYQANQQQEVANLDAEVAKMAEEKGEA